MQLRGGVEQITGRKVVAFMSANHIDPDMAAEVFVLEQTHSTAKGARRRGLSRIDP
jgi:hypothetical protein